jgi:imidazolonepropionase-like amidohydrolase
MTRDMGSNAESLVAFRERVEAGEAVGPRILMAGFIEGVSGSRTGLQVGDADEARQAVDHYADLGFVQIKIYNRLPTDLVRVVVERADQHGLRVSGHVPWGMTARQAVEAGFDEIQHIVTMMEGVALDPDEDVDDAEIAARLAALTAASDTMRHFIRLLASRGVAVDPTLAFFHAAGTVPPDFLARDLERFPEPFRRQLLDRAPTQWAGNRWSTILANMSRIVRALHEAGVPVLPGTDAMPGFTFHRELELYVAAGIPPSEVLALATIGAAHEMGMDDELGSIAPGMLADLIIVDGDPIKNISDIRRVVTVVKDGQVYDSGAIHRALGIQPCCP